MRDFILFAMIVSIFMAGLNCTENKNHIEDVIELYVTIPPQAFIVEQIGGEQVNVHVLVGPGQSPHTFEASPRQMMALGKAKVYFTAGFPFEKTLAKKIQASFPGLIIHSSMPEHDHSDSSHDTDPHVWLSPYMIVKIAEDVSEVLVDIDPENAGYYKNNLFSFVTKVNKINEQIGERLAPYRGAAFYVFHPAFGHFADAYGLRQVAVEVEGKSPGPRQVEQLIAKARSEGVHIIFTQPQFDQRSAEAIAAAIDGVVISIDPLKRDVLMNLQDIAMKIESALKTDLRNDRQIK